MLKAIFTFIDDDGKETKKEIKGVVSAWLSKETMYPDGNFYPTFSVDSRIDDCTDIDITPSSKLEFVYEKV